MLKRTWTGPVSYHMRPVDDLALIYKEVGFLFTCTNNDPSYLTFGKGYRLHAMVK